MLTKILEKNSEDLKIGLTTKLDQNKVELDQKMDAIDQKMDQKPDQVVNSLKETVSAEVEQQMEPMNHRITLLEKCLQKLEGNPTVSMVVDPPGVSFFSSGPNGRNLSATGPLPTSKVKVPTFDGEISWELYKSQFEVAAELKWME